MFYFKIDNGVVKMLEGGPTDGDFEDEKIDTRTILGNLRISSNSTTPCVPECSYERTACDAWNLLG